MKFPLNSIITEMNDKPYTMVTILAICGALTWGWFNVAWASDVEKLRKDTNTLLTIALVTEIRVLQDQLCALLPTDTSAKETLQNILEASQTKYQEQTGHRYPTKRC